MTIEKLDWGYKFGKGTEAEKINQIIDWINEHDNSGRHIVPSNSLTGGERTTEQKIVDHILYTKEPKSNSFREELGEGIREQMHKILHRIYADTYNQHKDIKTLISLVKESLIEKFEEEDYSTYSMAQVKQIIKNL